MNRDMRRFYRKLVNTENIGIVFKKYNDKVVFSEEPEKVNLPEGYKIANNDVFYYGDKIGKIEVYKENEDEIDLDGIDLEEISEVEETKEVEEDDNTVDFESEEDDFDEEIDDIEIEEEKTETRSSKVGFSIKKFFADLFERNNNKELEANEELDKEEDEVEEKPKKNIFKRMAQFIGYKVSRFFNNLGKKKEVEVSENELTEEEAKETETKETDNTERKVIKFNPKKEEKTEKEVIKNAEVLGTKFAAIENTIRAINTIIVDNTDLHFDKFTERLTEGKAKFEELFNKFVNNIEISELEVNKLYSSLDMLKRDIEYFVKNNKKNQNKPEVTNKTNKFTFTSIEDTKAKFEEYDKPEIEFKELEEKIAYYEEFLSTHDLSHADDQGMKQRMEEKLATLKTRYNEIMESKKDKNAENDLRTEKMAFYTQTSMGIDKAIDRMEKERKLKLLQAELNGETMINLGLAEERKLDEKKAELLRLKKECLERKAEVNSYYEEQAARMTAALKR